MATSLRKRILEGLGLVSKVTTNNTVLGDLDVSSGNNRLNFYGASNDQITTDNVTTTLTNKTIAAGSNTVTGLTNTNLSGSAGITNANLSTMAGNTIKGNNTGSSATPIDLTISQVNAILGTSSAATSIGALDAQAENATGLALVSNVLSAQSADGTHPGMVNITTQTFAGQKTFSTGITGTLTGNASNVTGIVALANGGTGQSSANPAFNALSPMTTGGDLIYGGASGVATRLANGSSGQFLKSNGTTLAPSWGAPSVVFTVPTLQKFTSTGSTTGYFFTVSSSNATIGATYTNNGNTYTVLNTIVAGTQLFTSGASTPLTSGTLTKATGTGDATITFSVAQAIATYTTPVSPAPLYIEVMISGGGGGGGSGSVGGGAGSNGLSSVFGTALLIANGGIGGLGGVAPGNGGAGGTASLGSITNGLALSGSPGFTSIVTNFSGSFGGQGGNTPFLNGGGFGGYGGVSTAGGAGTTNTGGGGGGAGSAASGTIIGGMGGGSGGFINAVIGSPNGTYVYAVGTGGAGGTGGSANGGAGAAGIILVKEYYS